MTCFRIAPEETSSAGQSYQVVNDEIARWVASWVMTPPSAAWLIHRFISHHLLPTVTKLETHTHIHTYTHTYTHTHIHTYTHTHIHTHIHTYEHPTRII